MQKQRDENGQETLSELDKLYIVHVNSGKPKERWNAGGPILPGLSVALANYPHTVVELEVSSELLGVMQTFPCAYPMYTPTSLYDLPTTVSNRLSDIDN